MVAGFNGNSGWKNDNGVNLVLEKKYSVFSVLEKKDSVFSHNRWIFFSEA